VVSLWRQSWFGFIFWPLSFLYGLAMSLRRFFYSRSLLPSQSVPVPVISVGNLSVGGTGKTPMVIRLAEDLNRHGLRPAVLTRGYGRKNATPLKVQGGDGDEIPTRMTGDEPQLITRRLPDIPVVVCRDRVRGARLALENNVSDSLILDDGFQHLRLRRQVDLVLIDASNPWGNRRLLPAGPLREPLSTVKQAQAVIITRADQGKDIDAVVAKIRTYTSAPVFTSVHTPAAFVSLRNGSRGDPGSLRGDRAFCFAGIGNPDSFYATVRNCGIAVIATHSFPDHHWYTARDIESIIEQAQQARVSLVITTEKDAVRLPEIAEWEGDIYFLQIDLKIREEEWDAFLDRIIERGTAG